jgi:hypothetical protein
MAIGSNPLSFEPPHFEPVRMGWIGSSPDDKRARVDRSLRQRWRVEPERAPLIRPCHRQVDKTLEAKAARQASLDCRLDDLRREESERQGHPNRTLAPALSRSERLQSQTGIGEKFVQPAVRVAEGLR